MSCWIENNLQTEWAANLPSFHLFPFLFFPMRYTLLQRLFISLWFSPFDWISTSLSLSLSLPFSSLPPSLTDYLSLCVEPLQPGQAEYPWPGSEGVSSGRESGEGDGASVFDWGWRPTTGWRQANPGAPQKRWDQGVRPHYSSVFYYTCELVICWLHLYCAVLSMYSIMLAVKKTYSMSYQNLTSPCIIWNMVKWCF